MVGLLINLLYLRMDSKFDNNIEPSSAYGCGCVIGIIVGLLIPKIIKFLFLFF